MKSKICLLVLVVALVAAGANAASPYIAWNGGMSAAQSSDLGGYGAQEAFDTHFGVLGYRSDWAYATGTAQGDAGFQLRTDGHGMWHSTANGAYTSLAGVACQEWLAADFGEVKTVFGVDIWNLDTFYWQRGIKEMSISVSTDGMNWATAWSGIVAAADGTLPDLMYDGVTFINPDDPTAVQYGRLYDDRVLFNQAMNAQFVVFNIFNQWDPAVYGNYIAVDEIKFLAVPEPATISMLALGFAALLKKKRS